MALNTLLPLLPIHEGSGLIPDHTAIDRDPKRALPQQRAHKAHDHRVTRSRERQVGRKHRAVGARGFVTRIILAADQALIHATGSGAIRGTSLAKAKERDLDRRRLGDIGPGQQDLTLERDQGGKP